LVGETLPFDEGKGDFFGELLALDDAVAGSIGEFRDVGEVGELYPPSLGRDSTERSKVRPVPLGCRWLLMASP
jgi:hypothetical protein